MMEKDLISIVMPVYNTQDYVQGAMEDIFHQSYKNIEFIIVNDGSTDHSREAIFHMYDGWKRNFQGNFAYIEKKNGGTGSALNLGFKLTSGKYGTWVSSDDRKEVNFIERLHDCFVRHPKAGLAFSAYFHEGENYNIHYSGALDNEIAYNFVAESEITCKQGPCFLFDMELKNKIGDFALSPGEDYLMSVKMGIKAPVVYLNEVLGQWRNNLNGTSARLRKEKAINPKATRLAFRLAKKFKGINGRSPS